MFQSAEGSQPVKVNVYKKEIRLQNLQEDYVTFYFTLFTYVFAEDDDLTIYVTVYV